MRDILSERKLHLKTNEVIHLDIPSYQELSVKNMYDDAMGDDVLSKYLPSKRQLSNKLPERHFFFGLLATLRKQYLTDVVRSAQDKRYSVQENDPKRQAILVTDKWQEELMRHPY